MQRKEEIFTQVLRRHKPEVRGQVTRITSKCVTKGSSHTTRSLTTVLVHRLRWCQDSYLTFTVPLITRRRTTSLCVGPLAGSSLRQRSHIGIVWRRPVLTISLASQFCKATLGLFLLLFKFQLLRDVFLFPHEWRHRNTVLTVVFRLAQNLTTLGLTTVVPV